MVRTPHYSHINQILCILVILAVCFTCISHGLWTPDEPREAAISLEMARTGDFLIPHLAGTPFVEKPPLYYIVASFMLKTLGPITGNTTAIRLSTVLFGLGVLLMTFFLGRSIGGHEVGIFSAVFLGSMEGFAENFHWIRVDAALSFFVIAAVFCLFELYHKDNYKFGPLAGLCLAGSFLSKGLIGPVFIAVPWFLLFVERITIHKQKKISIPPFVIYHLLLFLIFISLCALWIIPFYYKGGESLWHEWFWINNIGRFTGTTIEKGHVINGEPLFYVYSLLIYGIPLTPLFLFLLYSNTKQLIKTRHLEKNNLFIYLWGILSLILLSVSASKRAIYFTPVLPAYAIMAALSIAKGIPNWFKPYAVFWMVLSLCLIIFISLFPFMTNILPTNIPPHIFEGLADFGYSNVLSIIGFFACLALIFKFRDIFTMESILVFVTAVLYMSILGVPIKAIDQGNNVESDIKNFVSQIPASGRNRIAGFNLSETTVACLYYYSDLPVPLITDKQRADTILKGKDDMYDFLIINKKSHNGNNKDCVNIPYQVIARTGTGTDPGLYLIKGIYEDFK